MVRFFSNWTAGRANAEPLRTALLWIVFSLFVLVSGVCLPLAPRSGQIAMLLVLLSLAATLPFIVRSAHTFGADLQRPPMLFFLVFLGVASLSSFFSIDARESFEFVGGYAVLSGFAVALARNIEMRRLLQTLRWVLGMAVFLSFASHFSGLHNGYYHILKQAPATRFCGFYGEPNAMATPAALYILLTVIRHCARPPFPQLPVKSLDILTRSLESIFFAVSVWVLFASRSRTVLTAMAVALSVSLFLLLVGHGDDDSRKRLMRGLCAALLLALVLLPCVMFQRGDWGRSAGALKDAPPTYAENGPQPSPNKKIFGKRARRWATALEPVTQRPLLGYGLGSSSKVMKTMGEEWAGHTHNVFMEALLSTGALGFLSFTLFLGSLFVKGVGGFHPKDDVSLALLILVVFHFTYSLTHPAILVWPSSSLFLPLLASAWYGCRHSGNDLLVVPFFFKRRNS